VADTSFRPLPATTQVAEVHRPLLVPKQEPAVAAARTTFRPTPATNPALARCRYPMLGRQWQAEVELNLPAGSPTVGGAYHFPSDACHQPGPCEVSLIVPSVLSLFAPFPQGEDH